MSAVGICLFLQRPAILVAREEWKEKGSREGDKSFSTPPSWGLFSLSGTLASLYNLSSRQYFGMIYMPIALKKTRPEPSELPENLKI